MTQPKEDTRTFETVQDFIDHVKNTPPKPTWISAGGNDFRHSRTTSSRDAWYGSESFGHACELASNGWQDGLKRITECMDVALSEGRSLYRINDVAGDIPNIGRFLAGQPDSMTRRIVALSMKKPIIEITLNACYSAMTKADHIMNYGAAIATAIDDLENAGFRVSLSVGAIVSYSNNRNGILINLKSPSEQMDLDRLVFFLAHPSFLRRLCFGHWETVWDVNFRAARYGRVIDFNPSEYAEGSVYFKGANGLSMCSDMKGARAYVRNIIKQQRPDLFADDAAAA